MKLLQATSALAALIAAGALAGAVLAQPAPLSEPAAMSGPAVSRTISVTGNGHADAAPDIAVLTLGVTSDAPTAREALDKNNASMSAIIEALKGLGFGVTDIQTAGLSVNPQYNYDSGTPTLVSYQAANGVTLRAKDLSKLGQVIDIVVSKGANQINSLTFDVADQSAALSDARQKAIEDAKAKAELMATAAGVAVGRVLTISESDSSNPSPMPKQAMRAEAASSVPIAPGQVGLDAQVSVVFELN